MVIEILINNIITIPCYEQNYEKKSIMNKKNENFLPFVKNLKYVPELYERMSLAYKEKQCFCR